MNEYKFRAWDKENKRMTDIDGGNLYLAEGKVYEVCSGSFAMECTFEKKDVSDRYEIMQYSNFNDKKGTEIYEGDVLDLSCEYDRNRKGIVEFVNGCFRVKNLKHPDDTALLADILEAYENAKVIGNIYEDTRFLKSSQ